MGGVKVRHLLGQHNNTLIIEIIIINCNGKEINKERELKAQTDK